MDQHSDDRGAYARQWADDLDLLRQNWLFDGTSLSIFARDCGVEVFSRDVEDLHGRGWLRSDRFSEDQGPRYHPFRVLPLHKILEICVLPIAASATLKRDAVPRLVEIALSGMPSMERITELAHRWNQVIDLAVLLEPVYWPEITGQRATPVGINEEQHNARLMEYRRKVLDLVKSLDAEAWKERHESLRTDAARLDNNSEL